VLVDDLTVVDGTVRHCVIAADLAAALAGERELAALSTEVTQAR
jgi:hypothetical protein